MKTKTPEQIYEQTINENTFVFYVINTKNIVSIHQPCFDNLETAKTYLDGMAAAYSTINKNYGVMMFLPKKYINSNSTARAIHRNTNSMKFFDIEHKVFNHYTQNYYIKNNN